MWNQLLGCARVAHRNTKHKDRTQLFRRFPMFRPIRDFQPISECKLHREKWMPVKRVTPRSAIFAIQNTQHTYTNMVWNPLACVGIQMLRSPPPVKPQPRWRNTRLIRIHAVTASKGGRNVELVAWLCQGRPQEHKTRRQNTTPTKIPDVSSDKGVSAYKRM